MSTGRRGFTLVELVIVTVLGAVVLAAILQVLVTNQRTYTTQNAKIQAQQSTRAALSVLTSELREISAQDGDILAMGPDSITIRSMRKFGIACSVDLSSGAPVLDVIRVGDDFAAGDSVFVFADKNRNIGGDDVWISARVTSVDTTETCAGREAAELQFGGQIGIFTADSVRSGAPVRSFTRFTYKTSTLDGNTYLARTDSTGNTVPIVGPISSSNGLAFRYLDADGNTTADREDVRRIVVRVATYTGVRRATTGTVADSITAQIYTRN